MLLVVDVGNTNIVWGLYDGTQLLHHWRIVTRREQTADEYGIILGQLLSAQGLRPEIVDDVILASVVPPAVAAIVAMCQRYFHLTPLIVGPGIRTGMPILYDNPREVGADRIVNAVAAYERLHAGCIVIDFGTATTFDVVSPAGEYMGGAICPGVVVSAEALFSRAARLPPIEIVRPPHVIGKNTVASMQSGIVFGYAGLVDGLIARLKAALPFAVHTVATGGLAALIAGETASIEEVLPDLTLEGLRLLFERNHGA